MSDKPGNYVPLPAIPMDRFGPVQRRRRGGLFSKLFSVGSQHDTIEVGISSFIDAAGNDHAKTLQAIFSDIRGIRARLLRERADISPAEDRMAQLPLACADAIDWISRYKIDVVVWGDIPPPGTTLYIHIASKPLADEDPPGVASPFQVLPLPVGFKPELGALLRAAALATLCSTNAAKHTVRFALAPSFVEGAIEAMTHLPDDFTDRETAFTYASFANLLYALDHLVPSVEHVQRISLSYAQALKNISKTDMPVNWAYLQKNLGGILQSIGERGRGDVDTLERAKSAYTEALGVFSFERTPFPWAATQMRLGEVLYRLDLISGGTEDIKEALLSYQNALKVFTRQRTPHLWSEVMNNFSQASQFLGREMNDRPMIESAVSACRSSLEVRKKDKAPLPWALSQNNLGSGLFILGRMTEKDEYYEEAKTAFESAREVFESLGMKRMVRIIDKNLSRAEGSLPGGGSGKDWWNESDDSDLAADEAAAIADDSAEDVTE